MMYALATFTGEQRSEESQPVAMDQLHHRRQLTLQEDIIQVNGQSTNVSQEVYNVRQETQHHALSLEPHINQCVVSTRREFEHTVIEWEQKMQLRLEEIFRSSHAVHESTVPDVIQAITTHVETAEANLIEDRARLDEALGGHVANSHVIAPEHIAKQISQACDEGVHEALQSAQVSFQAAVDEKKHHASIIENRLLERVEQTRIEALCTAAAKASDCEARMQQKLEALLETACSHTNSRVASLEAALQQEFMELNRKLD